MQAKLLQDRIGQLVIGSIPIVEGDDHRVVRQTAATAPCFDEIYQRNHVVLFRQHGADAAENLDRQMQRPVENALITHVFTEAMKG